jgi:ATP-dependent protease ClpP protease subunit
MKDCYWGNEVEDLPTEKEKTTPHEFASESATGHASTDRDLVEFSHNRIYFYSGVTRPKILKLNKGIFNLNVNLSSRTSMMEYQPPPIKLHINSYGGSVFAGLSAVDYIKNSKIPVHSVIDGCAASAATLMSVVAHRRYMHRNACMLVHELSGLMWGKFKDMKDDMENSNMLMEKIRNIYKQHTKIPQEELDKILEHDLWWEAEKCLEYGMVDEII